MDTISYSTARANLASTMDRVCEDHEPLIITRNGQQSVVMLSLGASKLPLPPIERRSMGLPRRRSI